MIQEVFASFTSKIPVALLIHGEDFTDAELCVLNLFQESCEDKKTLKKPKIDELKVLTQWINFQPSKKYKVIELYDIEAVSKEVINYLLKAVEDSPIYLKWVLYSRSKYLNKALLSRCCVIPAISHVTVKENDFDQVIDYGTAYDWFLRNKEEQSDADFKESLISCCDILLQKQTSFDRIHLVQKYKNLIKKESAGYENSFKFLLTQVF